jgi:hypothetical protein
MNGTPSDRYRRESRSSGQPRREACTWWAPFLYSVSACPFYLWSSLLSFYLWSLLLSWSLLSWSSSLFLWRSSSSSLLS